MTNRLVILGPQRPRPNLDRVLSDLAVSGRIAVVTAGWQQREGEVEELGDHLGRPVADLRLYARAEAIFERDPEFFAAYRERQDRLRALRELYGRRLHHALDAARELLGLDGDSDLLARERGEAISAVRELDRHHLKEIAKIHRDFGRHWRPGRRASVAAERRELATVLADCDVLAIAGGHVAVLLNRLRLFGVLDLAAGKPLVAWSAGAMVLAERIVLFHDSPPQGAGNTEVLEAGFGLLGAILPFPHARRRLQLEDPNRVGLIARRFAPALCVALDAGDGLAHEDGWRTLAPLRLLSDDGTVRTLEGEIS